MFFQSLFIEAKTMLARSGPGIESLEIYKHTGLMFLRNNDLSKINTDLPSYIPAGNIEGGYMFLLPLMSILSGINYLTLLNYLFYFILFLSLLSVLYFIINFQKKTTHRVISIFFVFIVNAYMYKKLFGTTAEHLMYFYSVQLILPIIILIYYNKIKNLWPPFLIIFFICLIIDQFRSHACLGSFIILCFVVFVKKKKIITRLISTALLIFYIAIPIFLQSFIEKKQMSNFQLLNNKNFSLNSMSSSIWPIIYRGMGFIHGKIDGFEDSVIIEYLKKNGHDVEPIYLTKENNQIIKNEVLNTFKNDPGFFLRLYSAKFGVIIFYFFIFANIGIVNLVKNYKNKFFLFFSFFISFCIYSLPPLIATPHIGYLGGIVGLGLIIFCHSIIKNEN